MDYLKALLPDARTDVIFTGYQASGTLGRSLQQRSLRQCSLQQKAGSVWIDDTEVAVKASVQTISGYSAHADQQDLVDFIVGCKTHLKQLHLIHGERRAKQALVECVTPYLEPVTRIVS
jgi:metallo-beta-lactamase family protein